MISPRWWPSLVIHSSRRFLNARMTCSVIAGGIAAISWWIAVFHICLCSFVSLTAGTQPNKFAVGRWQCCCPLGTGLSTGGRPSTSSFSSSFLPSSGLGTYDGGLKITRIIFLKWFIRFCTITFLVSFKVLSFWLSTLVPMFFPLLKTFLELFSADVVQDVQRFLFHFADASKTFPFHLAFHTREQEKVAWRKVGWIGRIFCLKLLHTPCRVGRGIVVVKEPITAASHVWLFFLYTIA